MAYFGKRYHPPGTAPGTLIPSESTEVWPLSIRVMDYDADYFEDAGTVGATDCRAYLDQPTITWIHVQGTAEPDVLYELGTQLDLHPLALEDILNSGQRPKVETYPNQYFVIASLPVQRNGSIEVEQVSLFLGDRYVVSFHQGRDDPFEPVRKRLRNGVGRLRTRGAGYLLYTLLDLVIDQGFPALEAYGDNIENVEEELLESPTKETLARIHELKRNLLLLRRMLWPQREVLNTLMREASPLIGDDTHIYLRDCYDHTIQIMDLLETYRDMISGMVDVYLSSVSNRLNEVMRVLTVIATIFIPPSFIASVYGMNFDRQAGSWNMPELGWPYGYLFAWFLMVAMIGGMIIFFKRKKWF
jgi:magnesium transporter